MVMYSCSARRNSMIKKYKQCRPCIWTTVLDFLSYMTDLTEHCVRDTKNRIKKTRTILSVVLAPPSMLAYHRDPNQIPYIQGFVPTFYYQWLSFYFFSFHECLVRIYSWLNNKK